MPIIGLGERLQELANHRQGFRSAAGAIPRLRIVTLGSWLTIVKMTLAPAGTASGGVSQTKAPVAGSKTMESVR